MTQQIIQENIERDISTATALLSTLNITINPSNDLVTNITTSEIIHNICGNKRKSEEIYDDDYESVRCNPCSYQYSYKTFGDYASDGYLTDGYLSDISEDYSLVYSDDTEPSSDPLDEENISHKLCYRSFTRPHAGIYCASCYLPCNYKTNKLKKQKFENNNSEYTDSDGIFVQFS